MATPQRSTSKRCLRHSGLRRGLQHQIGGDADAERQIVEQVEDVVVAQRQQPQADDAGRGERLRPAREDQPGDHEAASTTPIRPAS